MLQPLRHKERAPEEGDERWKCRLCSQKNVMRDDQCKVCHRPKVAPPPREMKEAFAAAGGLSLEMKFVEAGKDNKATQILRMVEMGVSVNAVDPRDGRTALHQAAMNNSLRALRVLVKNGAAIDFKSFLGRDTALHLASYAGHNSAVRLLLGFGAVPDEANAQGFTPLHYASTIDVLDTLVTNKADIFKENRHGKTPLDTISARGDEYMHVVKRLQKYQEDAIRWRFKAELARLRKQKEVMLAQKAREEAEALAALQEKAKKVYARPLKGNPDQRPEKSRRRVSLFATEPLFEKHTLF